MNKKQQREAAKAAKLAAQQETQRILDAADAQGLDLDPAQVAADVKADVAKTAKKTKKTPAAQTVTLPDGTIKTLVAIPTVKRERKAKPAKACSCGCGGQTKGGRFIPGHDSRLHSWVRAVGKGLVALADIPDGERQAVEAHMNAAK